MQKRGISMRFFDWFKKKQVAQQRSSAKGTPTDDTKNTSNVSERNRETNVNSGKKTETFTVPDIYYSDNITSLNGWKPIVMVPDYDKLFSLERLLSRGDRRDINVAGIMENKDPINAAHIMCMRPEKGKPVFDAYAKVASMAIKIRTIYNSQTKSQYEFIIEQFFQYLLYSIGEFTSWDYRLGKAESDYAISSFLRDVGNDDECNVIKRFDKEVISCFCLAYGRNDEPFSSVWSRFITKYGEDDGTFLNSFISSFGKQKILGIILKIFQCMSKQQKYDLEHLLLKEESIKKYDPSGFVFNIDEMIKADTFQDKRGCITTRYYPNINQRKAFIDEAVKLNPVIQKAQELIHEPLCLIEPKSICFDSQHRFSRPAQIRYSPNTATGKISKYPFIIDYEMQDSTKGQQQVGSLNASVYYTQNNEIGKADIVMLSNGVKIECKQMKGGSSSIQSIALIYE